MPLHGLIAAVHSPFHTNGDLALDAVEAQCGVLLRQGLSGIFVCGSTGESHSLNVDERCRLTERWAQVLQGTPLQLIVHVGSNCLRDSEMLASHAQKMKAIAISAQAPSYFRPKSVADLVVWCQSIASAAPETPFYFYDIPVMTGVALSMPDLLNAVSEQIPNFAGLKFTNTDLMSFQLCQRACGGRFDIAFGVDEMLLAAVCLGAKGAVGSSYNFAGQIYRRIIAAFESGRLETAREEQFRSVQLIQVLAGLGYMGAARAVMEMLGAPIGPPRLPNNRLDQSAKAALKTRLQEMGFFEWIR
ncbi:MAG: dihydrodipicolinate synthase family protein [Planctomycetaceae bacterium]|nr:dihydrodipicolinate synthase family protein [Planctomycetaceae bacterium]